MSYAARHKYDAARAARYAARSPRREREEAALLERALAPLTPTPATAWDVPCGTGRIAAQLIARGLSTRCGDLSPAMRARTHERLRGQAGYAGVVALDLDAALDLPPADLVVCFRFLHHLPDATLRRAVLRQLRSLCTHHLLVSFHHPVSAHNLGRGVRRVLGGAPSDRHTLSVRTLARDADAAGFRPQAWLPLGRYRRELWLAHMTPK